MQFKLRWMGVGTGILLSACNTTQDLKNHTLNQQNSVQDVIEQKKLNNSNGTAKDYVYDWGLNKKSKPIEAIEPKQHINAYCQSKNGKFSQTYQSSFSFVKDAIAKKNLVNERHLREHIGAYQCLQSDGKKWWVSIEPIGEYKENADVRRVRLLTQAMTAQQVKNFYAKTTAKPSVKKTGDKADSAKPTNSKALKTKEPELIKETKVANEPEVKAAVKIAETPQQQQTKLYVAARRDINKGTNQVTACNNAQRAYNYGKLQGTEGTQVYTESGMLVVKCLTSISAYSNRFGNPKAQATKILQNLAQNYNHGGAKNMLRKMK